MNFSDIIYTILTAVVNVLVIFLHYSIRFVSFSYRTQPELTSAIFFLLAVYVLFKTAVRVVKMWLRILVTTVKTVLGLTVILLCALVYLRGYNTIVGQDIPFVKQMYNSFTKQEPEPFSVWSFLGQLIPLAEAGGYFEKINDMKNMANDVYESFQHTNAEDFERLKNFEGFEELDHVTSYLSDLGVDVNGIMDALRG